ncbi:3-hydroxyacyl-CoA dehydrogenase/enoyl-CoA hydratase family protein [Halomarina rubra]|uniref:enoyl-CoA hydratase n=1 Tax=Halomarina rubra TaxID=2071873 RepID=A0ABD6AX99_9EURY|nr:3-hydroxyacyl-CoA dehydrogenase NAD-binding domain-containing protein [Halomarina rubra]
MADSSGAPVETVTVVGAGSMGHGIAQVFATNEYDVTLVDVDPDQLATATDRIAESLARLGEDPDTVMERLTTTTDQEDGLVGADLMVEAVPERIELKRDIFEAADRLLPPSAILATNTSTLPVTEMAEVTDHPERVVGMHFSNPVPLMEIVEVIRGEETSDEVLDTAVALSEAVGKTPVVVRKDVPGFILNRINYAFWSEALRVVDEGTHDFEAVDAANRRLGFPMGPFEVLDFAGIDVFYMVCEALQDRDVPVVISETHRDRVEADAYGMKSGRGFYDYPAPGEYSRVDIPMDRRYEYDPLQMIASAVNAAAWLLDEDVATKEAIDTSMEIGMNWPRGLFEFADEYGVDRIVDTLQRLYDETGREQYRPHDLLVEMVEEGRLGWATGEGFYDHDYDQETFGSVEYERQEFVAYVTFSRPEKRNAMDEGAWRGLRSALERAREDDAVRATVLRGSGGAFSAGDDIQEMLDWETVEEGKEFLSEVLLPAIEDLRTHPMPTISLVDGVATGAGCEMVLLSDMAVASSGSRFGQPEGKIGAFPPMWATYGVTNLGKKSVLELAMTSDLVTARKAEDIGLLNYVLDGDQATDVARELARSTTANAPGSNALIKSTWTGLEADLVDEWFEDAAEDLAEQLLSEEGRHGLAAFLNKETPRWER